MWQGARTTNAHIIEGGKRVNSWQTMRTSASWKIEQRIHKSEEIP